MDFPPVPLLLVKSPPWHIYVFLRKLKKLQYTLNYSKQNIHEYLLYVLS